MGFDCISSSIWPVCLLRKVYHAIFHGFGFSVVQEIWHSNDQLLSSPLVKKVRRRTYFASPDAETITLPVKDCLLSFLGLTELAPTH